MTWQAQQRDSFTAQDIYSISLAHRLEWHNLDAFVGVCRSAARAGELHDIVTGDGENVGIVLVSGIMDGETASLELVPDPKHLVGDFADDIRAVMIPLLGRLFREYSLRRVTAVVPYSRFRTRKALRECGFAQEGKLAEGVHLRGFDPEDLYIFGMTARKYREKKHGMV